MSDIYEQIYQELTSKLPRNEDIELLKVLINALKKGGKDLVKSVIKELIQEIEEGEV